MKKLVFLAVIFAGCAGPVTKKDFDTTGFDKDMMVRFIGDDRFCRTLSDDMKKRFGIGAIPYSQCMYERGYRFKTEKEVFQDE